MTSSNSNNNTTYSVYFLTKVELPKGHNNVGKIADTISQSVRKEFGLNVETYIPTNDVAEPVFTNAKEKYVSKFNDNSFPISKHIYRNITSLVSACKGNTWFSPLDELIRRLGSVDNLFKQEKPGFRINIQTEDNVIHTYYFKEASMEKQPYVEKGKTLTALVNGEPTVLYLYTFEFNPGKESPELQDVFGTKHLYPEAQDPKLLSLVKDNFSGMAGWGIPSIKVDTNGEEIWYDQTQVRMGIVGNNIHVLAPGIDTYEKTVKAVVKAKLATATAEALNVRPESSTTSKHLTLE